MIRIQFFLLFMDQADGLFARLGAFLRGIAQVLQLVNEVVQ